MAALSSSQEKSVRLLYFRKKLGAPAIARLLGVSPWAVYYFMRRAGLKRRTFLEENQIRFQRKKPSFRLKRRLSSKEKELKSIGVMLYWAEGFQADGADIVDFSNSKPEMVAIFLKFLRKVCHIDESRLRGFIYCYANQNTDQLIHFWSTVTRIPKRQFTKPYVRSDFRQDKINKMPQGLLHIRYYDKKLLLLIRKWIKEYVDKFTRR